MTAPGRVNLAFWASETSRQPEIAGVAGIGGAGQTEVLYRHHEELAHLLRIIPFHDQATVVELGCGTGRWVASLAGLVKQYIGVDFSHEALEVARQRARELELLNVTLVEASATEYAPAVPVDILYLSGVTQYLRDEELVAALQGLVRRLSPGALVVDRSTLHRRARTVTDTAHYFSIYRTGPELIRLFERAGLKCDYQRPSYRFLVFPWPVQLLLRSRLARWCVKATSPGSFALLRVLTGLSSSVFRPSGETLDFSHDFLRFHLS